MNLSGQNRAQLQSNVDQVELSIAMKQLIDQRKKMEELKEAEKKLKKKERAELKALAREAETQQPATPPPPVNGE